MDFDAGGDIASVEFGDLTLNVAAGATMEYMNYISIDAGGDIGSVSFGNLTANIAADGYVYVLQSVDIQAGGNIGDVTFGDHLVTIGVDGSRTDYDSVQISATGDIGNVSFGDIVYDLAADAYTTSGLSRTIDAGGTLGDVTFGDVRMLAETSAYFSYSYNFNVRGDDGIGAVTFGEIELNGLDIVDSMDVNIAVTATSGDIASLTVGNIVMSNAANDNAGTDLFLDLDVYASGAIGDVTLGDITMAATGTDTNDAGGAYVDVNWNVGSFTGDVNVGVVSFEGNASYTDTNEEVLAVDLGTIDADVVVAGITIKGDGTAVMGDNYIFALDGSGDVTINNISVDISASTSGLYSLTDILTDVSNTGTITLGTVDYSGYDLTENATNTGGETINVSGYLGEIAVIGTTRDDTITDNDEANSLTGGGGDDEFIFVTVDQDIDSTTAAASAVIDVVTDFAAGALNYDILTINADTTGISTYIESSADSFDGFITEALAKMTDSDYDYNVVAVQVGNDTWIAVDEDGGNDIDHIIQVTNVGIATLNYADFNIV